MPINYTGGRLHVKSREDRVRAAAVQIVDELAPEVVQGLDGGERVGGADGTRTRDLRRDRPAF